MAKAGAKGGPQQLPLLLEHRVAHGVEDFLVAASNRRAVEWIDRWPDWPFTALIVVGPEGSGKTHLAELWRERAGASTPALAEAGLEATAQASRGGAVLVDDCDRVVADPAAELALLQLYNLLRAGRGTMVLTARRTPSAWRLTLADLASRLNSAMVMPLDPPDDSLLAAIALKQFADRQLIPAKDVIPLILTRSERSFAAIARTVAALDRAALGAKRRTVTEPLAREVLAELWPQGEGGGA